MSEAQVFIDHLTIPVRDAEASRVFYRQALAPFGVEEVELLGGFGWGPPDRVDFFITQGEPTAPLHLAFAAPDRATVDAFHAAALAAGGTDNGAPGLRPLYHPDYYGAYVIDLDGHNVEAVFHGPPTSPPVPRRMTARDELAAFNERFSAALAGQDADAVVDLYTGDARLLFTGMPMIRGREAIAKMMGAWLAESPHQMTFQTGDIWEAGDIVVDVGTYDSPRGTGKYVVLYERQADGSLKLAVDAVSLDGDAS